MKDGKFLADIHLHSEYSHDSVCPAVNIYKAALENHVDLVCITDHCDLYAEPGPDETVKDRKAAFENLRRDTENCPGVEVLIGVELGAGFIYPQLAQRIVDEIPYDMVIGSVHGIMFRGQRISTSKCDFGAMDDAAMMEYLDCHMEATCYIAEKLDVDVLGHLTYVFRYLNGRYNKNLDWHVLEKLIRRVFRAIIERGIALEINTSCVGSNYDEWLPTKDIIDLYIEMGGRLFTLGSDDHKAKKLCNGFDAVKAYLREKGIESLVYYKNRVAHHYSI